MAVPRNRSSNSRKKARRGHHALKMRHIGTCPKCGEHVLPHRMCNACGAYKEHTYKTASE